MTMATPLPDPFAAEVVGVPTVGVRDWLQQRLALRLGAGEHDDGVAANIQMVFPNRFIAAALGGHIDEVSPWDLDRLTWTVLQVIDAGRVSIPGRRTGAYSTARRIADLFDRYANNRPQLLQQWGAGHFGDGTEDDRQAVVPLAADHVWQAHLWRAVRDAIGQPTSAERLPELLADLRAGRIEPRLPERVALFGLSAVSSSQLAVVQALAVVRDVHLHLVHPSTTGWQQCRHQLAGRLVPRSAVDATAAVQHPLLRSWGRPPMETAALVAGLDVVVEQLDRVEHLDQGVALLDAPPISLLERIQADIRRDQPIEPGAFAATDQDRSIQLHACHGTTRQIEVLRDALGHLFAADPTLAAHEVAILCPDLDRFAPLLQSVFQRSSLPIPVRVSDLTLGTGNPVGAALATLLSTIAGRCTAADILQLITLDPISRRFGFDDEDAELINRWLDELGTTWGLDGDHRGEWVPSHIVEGTWSATLDRLLLGGSMPAPSPRVGPGGVVPFDDIDANGMAVAGRLAELVARLRDAKQRCSGQRCIGEWAAVLLDLIDGFLATHPNDSWQIAEIVEEISAIAENATSTTSTTDVALPLSDARLVLAGALGGDRGRLAMRSGAVTASAFLPVRNVTSRVVCVLGLDDASMRSSGVDGDDILGLRPCIGERDQRVEGRHMLLDALMAAGEHFLVTFDGSDITTNRPLPSPVHLAELIDVIDALRRGDSNASTSIITRHPRQAYDERNFGAGVGDQPASFDTAMLAAAMARRSAVGANEPWPLLSPLVPAVVDLAQLADSCTRPERTLLHRRLDIRLPPEATETDVSIPLQFVGLDTYQLGRELLELHRQGADEAAIESWRQANRRSGALPPRALADATLADTALEVALVTKCRVNGADVTALMQAASATFDVEIHRPIGESQGHGADQVIVRDTIGRIAGDQVVRVSFTRPGNRSIIAAALDLAALVATDPQRPWHALVVNRPKSGAFKVSPVEVRPRDQPDRQGRALALIDAALAFHLRALREPLPHFEKSSLTLADHETIDDEEFGRDIRSDAAQLLWGTYTADDILAIPLRTDDEMPAISSAVVGRAQALANYLWSSVRAFVDMGDDRSTNSDESIDATSDSESSGSDGESPS